MSRTLRAEIEGRKKAVALIHEVDGGATIDDAARRLGMGPRKAAEMLRRYKVTRKRRRIPEGVDIREYAEGMSIAKAAELLEVSTMTVSRALREAGEQRPRGRTPTIDVEEVKSMRAAGYSYQDIADVLGCSRKGVEAVYRDGRNLSRRIDPGAVVDLRDNHGYGWADIGRHLDCHPDTARKLYYKTKREAGRTDPAPGE